MAAWTVVGFPEMEPLDVEKVSPVWVWRSGEMEKLVMEPVPVLVTVFVVMVAFTT